MPYGLRPIKHHSAVRGMLVACLALACSGAADEAPTSPDVPGVTPTGSLPARRVFPADNPWNRDISGDAVDPNSAALIASCGVRNLHPDFGSVYGIPYVMVAGAQPKVPV